MSPPFPPRQEYAGRRGQRHEAATRLAGRERLVGNGKLVLFLAALALAYLVFGAGVLSAWWLLPPALLFAGLLVRHDQLKRRLRRARQAVAFYDAGLARLDDAWKGRGQKGERFADDQHLYAADLDLFGEGSLFELLCTARTRSGEDTLAAWLKAPARPDEVRARQLAVAELRPQIDLREDLALLGGDLPAGVDFDAVCAWGAAPPVLVPRWPAWPVRVLGVLSVTTFVCWQLTFWGLASGPVWDAVGAWGSVPFVLVAVLQVGLALWLGGKVRRVLAGVERRQRDVATLARVLQRLEQASFTTLRLQELHAALDPADGVPPSQQIARLGNLLELLDSRRNQFFAPFAFLLMWGTQMAYAIDAWRTHSGPAIREWLGVVGQFEALCALAAYAYENPADPFPEVVDEGPCYVGDGLAHPLMPRGQCVPNDLRLGAEPAVLLVSGSNMSGKSTFLRTVGVNAVLALAGAPVRARRLRLSPLALGATLRIQDSLQAGRSRFYAEILRVRAVVDLTRGSVPLLFLLDELFAGTNSHDRRLGAEAVVRGLVDAGAIGLVTTHDLSLTQIADGLGARSVNVHFADHFEGGEMKFDYRLHAGVVAHSNALALMRAVGLKV